MTTCTIPPVGWFCTREIGHDGPCAADLSPSYKKGVKDSLRPLTCEEAIACGFPQPYSEALGNTPLSRLLELRKKRLLDG